MNTSILGRLFLLLVIFIIVAVIVAIADAGMFIIACMALCFICIIVLVGCAKKRGKN